MDNAKPRLARIELPLLLAGLLVFFLINFFSADKSPAVWCDEVMYADPAVNLYQGHGFTSGAWYAQHPGEFWAGNVPLYQFVLFGWLKRFGFSLVTVRSFHYAAFGAAIFIFWCALRRTRIVSEAGARLLFCLMMGLCSSSAFVYRAARPESVCAMLVALGLVSATLKNKPLRLALLFLIGALVVWSGLQMAVFAAAMSAVLWLVYGARFRRETVCLGAGCGLGLVGLWIFYHHFGVFGEFLLSIRRHTAAGLGGRYAGSASYGSGLGDKLKGLPKIYADPGFALLLVTAFWMLWRARCQNTLRRTSPLVFSFCAAVVIPLSLYVAGVFPNYYVWMAFVGLAVGVCAEISRFTASGVGSAQRALLAVLLVLVCLSGLPKRLIAASVDWQARDYGTVMKLASPYVASNEVVLSEFSSYYAAKQFGAEVILPPCIPVLNEQEKAAISVAIVRGQDVAALGRDYGGSWRDAGAFLPRPKSRHLIGLNEQLDGSVYDLRVFVRAPKTF